MINRIHRFLSPNLRFGVNAVLDYDEDDQPCLMVITSQRQGLVITDECEDRESSYAIEREILGCDLPVKAKSAPLKITGSTAQFLRMAHESIPRDSILALDSAPRVKAVSAEIGASPFVYAICAVDEDTSWHVHLVYSKEQAHLALLSHEAAGVKEFRMRAVQEIDDSLLPLESPIPAIHLTHDAGSCIGFDLEILWLGRNGFLNDAPKHLG